MAKFNTIGQLEHIRRQLERKRSEQRAAARRAKREPQVWAFMCEVEDFAREHYANNRHAAPVR